MGVLAEFKEFVEQSDYGDVCFVAEQITVVGVVGLVREPFYYTRVDDDKTTPMNRIDLVASFSDDAYRLVVDLNDDRIVRVCFLIRFDLIYFLFDGEKDLWALLGSVKNVRLPPSSSGYFLFDGEKVLNSLNYDDRGEWGHKGLGLLDLGVLRSVVAGWVEGTEL